MPRQNKKRKFQRRRRINRRGYHHRIRRGQDMDSYAERNEILLELGFRDYKQYLRSALWKGIRKRVLERDNGICYGCFRLEHHTVVQVHHGKYTISNLTGQSLEHLFTICGRCHKWIEVTKNGYKRTPDAATRELLRIRKSAIVRGMDKPYVKQNDAAPLVGFF